MKAFTDWDHLTFAHPFFFILLLLIPVMIWWEQKGRKDANPSLRLTTISGLKTIQGGAKARFRPALLWLRLVAILMLIVALARPQSTNATSLSDSDGIDIVLSMDISGSMMAEDFEPNRLEAAKKVALDFVDKRPNDRMGLVIFASESFTMCPITIDHNVVKEQIKQIRAGLLVDGTAIGYGLATAVDRLRNSKAESKVIILMTDGISNSGDIAPETALEMAKTYKMKVYTIGVGTKGQALMPIPTPMGIVKQMQEVKIDEDLLRKIATETGGRYFRATGNNSLERIYADIDKMEKTKVEMTSYKYYTELFFPFAMIAILCLTLELALRYTVFRTVT